jgi:hypothetical protein
VQFQNLSSAQMALDAMDGFDLAGQKSKLYQYGTTGHKLMTSSGHRCGGPISRTRDG